MVEQYHIIWFIFLIIMKFWSYSYRTLTWLTNLGFGWIWAIILIDLFFVHQEQEKIAIIVSAILWLVIWRFYGLQKNINQLITSIQQRDIGPMRIILQLLCIMLLICSVIAWGWVYGVAQRVRGEWFAVFG